MAKSKERKRAYQKETRLIHGDFHSPHWDYRDHIVPPISASAAYRLESAERGAQGFQAFANPEFNRHVQPPIYIYDRLDEPSRSMLEDNLAAAEEGECAVCFSTGMAAIMASLGVLARAGDRILAHRTLYGCTYSLLVNWLPRFGVRVDMLDFKDEDALERAMGEDVVAVYFETPSNPILELVDLSAVRALVDRANAARNPKKRRIYVVVDNTFATPFCQRPLSLGADVVVESLTKNIGGFGTDMGGVWVGPQLLEPDVLLFRKDFGAPLSPKAAWPPLVYGLPTLALRSRRQVETALKVARYLEGHPAVERVVYPGLPSHPQHVLARKQMLDPGGAFAPGIMIYFLLKGSPEEARDRGRRMMNHLADHSLAVTLAVSLGQIRTLIEHPSSMTHAPLPVDAQVAAGIDPGGIRISAGLESPEDIMGDLEEALDAL
jgi:methionine-gamma-lyase